MSLLRMLMIALAACATVDGKEAVVLLHGLARTSRSMERMETAFVEAGYVVLNVDYQSRRASIATLSANVVGGAMSDSRLSSCTRIHFVTHSLGGILVRSYFANRTDRRLGRVVMLGPPNQGSEVVDRLGAWWAFRSVNGPVGAELGTAAGSVPLALGPVKFELGVIAGDRTINWINSLMIPGPDDVKVSIEHTKVIGMKEHLVVHVSHPFLMRDSTVIKASLRFARTGSFAEKMPNKSPEPTTTAVTPRAGARVAPAAAHL